MMKQRWQTVPQANCFQRRPEGLGVSEEWWEVEAAGDERGYPGSLALTLELTHTI